MSRMKLIVLGSLAAFVLSAVAASTASARHEFTVNGVAIKEKVEITGQAAQGQLEFEVGTTALHLTCNQPGFGPVDPSNYIEGGGKGHLKIEFSGCTVFKIENSKPVDLPECKVKEGKTTVEASGELEPTEAGQVKITSVSGTLNIEKSTNPCGVETSGSYEGKQICDIPSYGFESTVGVLACSGTGSNALKFGGKSAKIYIIGGVAGTKGQKLGQT